MNDWTNVDIITAIRNFAKGKEVQCRIRDSIWTFKLSQDNNSIILDKRMIDYGEWFIKFESNVFWC